MARRPARWWAYAASQTVFGGGTAVGSIVDGSEIVSAGGVTSAVRVDRRGGDRRLRRRGERHNRGRLSVAGLSGNGEIGVASGGTMLGGVINHDGYAYLSGRSPGRSAPTLSGGDLALGGGTAIATTIGTGGIETVAVVYVFSTGAYASPGLASATTIAGGTLDLAGGSATGGILFAGSGPGLLEISGTVAPSTAIGGFAAANDEIDLQSVAFAGSGFGVARRIDGRADGDGGRIELRPAARRLLRRHHLQPQRRHAASGTIVTIDNGGSVDISSGVTSSGIVLSNGAVLNVLSGGTSLSATVSAGGIGAISGGASAIGTLVNSRGLDEVLSGGSSPAARR